MYLKTTLLTVVAYAILFSTYNKAIAAEWIIDKNRSQLEFTIQSPSSPMKGYFEDFDAVIDFDPNMLSQSAIEIIIQTGTLKLENAQHQSLALSKDWLDSLGFPEAQFQSTSIIKTDNGDFISNGFLTLKNARQPIAINFTVTIKDTYAYAEGSAQLFRSQFGVGGPENTNIPLADDFNVTFKIHANQR